MSARALNQNDAGAVRFHLAPLAMAIEAQVLRDWVERAAAGETQLYAQGTVPPRTSATWVLAGELAAAKLVTLKSRKLADGKIEWLAEKLAPQTGAAGIVLTTIPDPMMRRVADEVLRCANAGEPCPTDGELVLRCDLPGADAANYRLRKAVKAGLVQLQRPMQPGERRIATDPKTGKSTRRALV